MGQVLLGLLTVRLHLVLPWGLMLPEQGGHLAPLLEPLPWVAWVVLGMGGPCVFGLASSEVAVLPQAWFQRPLLQMSAPPPLCNADL